MSHRIILVLLVLSLASPSFAVNSINEWVLSQENSQVNPGNFQEMAMNADSVTWVGKIENIRSYADDSGEARIEYLCRYLDYRDESQNNPSYFNNLSDSKGYFVFSAKLPTLAENSVNDLVSSLRINAEIAVVQGFPYEKKSHGGDIAIYVDADSYLTTTVSKFISNQ